MTRSWFNLNFFVPLIKYKILCIMHIFNRCFYKIIIIIDMTKSALSPPPQHINWVRGSPARAGASDQRGPFQYPKSVFPTTNTWLNDVSTAVSVQNLETNGMPHAHYQNRPHHTDNRRQTISANHRDATAQSGASQKYAHHHSLLIIYHPHLI